MVVDGRQITKGADGRDWSASREDDFNYAQFYSDMSGSERIQIARDELTWIQRYERPDEPAEVVLNLSCGVQTVPHLMLLQVALFQRLGVNFVATAGSSFCCGRLYHRYDKSETGDRMAATAIDRFRSWGPTVNVQCCGSCFIEFDYHVARMREQGNAPFEVIHITEFLRDTIRRLGDKVNWRREIPVRVLLHAEGAEVHESKAHQRQVVIDTLDMIPGVEFVGLVDPPSLGQPCATAVPGGPSVLNDLTPEQYRDVQRELEEQARRAGADLIVTHHHMCHREWSKFSSTRLPIVHYQAVLGEALGVSIPDRFQALWRLGDPEKILERTRRYWESWGMPEPKARDLVNKFFVPKYASAVQRCPCEGSCSIGHGGLDGRDACGAGTARTAA